MRNTLFALTCALAGLFSLGEATACTSAIISGKLTKDGRPILWKNQDTSELMNCVMFHKGKKYDYVGVKVSGKNPYNVWDGTNSAGFSIINTLSYNQKDALGYRNGTLMADALGICATVEDFRHYLDTLRRPMYANSNYGVIDAQGGAAYFETTNTGYTMYDVNDINAAPDGYIVRSNFSVSGVDGKGVGYMRYQTASREIYNAGISKSITPLWVMETLSHSFANPLLGVNLRDGRHNKPETTGWYLDADFIARMSTSCATVIQGVKKGEKPEFTTMWSSVGYPPVSPMIPVWVKGADKKLPALLCGKEGDVWLSPLCKAADKFRKEVFSYSYKDRKNLYFNWELLYNRQGTGYMQKCERMEQELFQSVNRKINTMREGNSLSVEDAYAVYDECDAFVAKRYKEDLNTELLPEKGKETNSKNKKK